MRLIVAWKPPKRKPKYLATECWVDDPEKAKIFHSVTAMARAVMMNPIPGPKYLEVYVPGEGRPI